MCARRGKIDTQNVDWHLKRERLRKRKCMRKRDCMRKGERDMIVRHTEGGLTFKKGETGTV